jgi:RES domain-containing protein
MRVFRIASREYAPDNSEGARFYGGRWNQPGTPVIYAAATKSLATIEVVAHRRGIPRHYQIIVIEIPDDLNVDTIERNALPDGWSADSPDIDTAVLGTRWAASLKSAVLKVPSAIYPDEYNYVLNPLHPDFPRIRFQVSTEKIDRRLEAKP